MVMPDPAHQSHWPHTDWTRMLPHKDTPSRLGWVNVSPNFIETEKVKQNEKTEEFVSIERTRENP